MRIFDTFIVAEISHEFERGLELTLISRKEFKELESNYMDFLRINERHTS